MLAVPLPVNLTAHSVAHDLCRTCQALADPLVVSFQEVVHSIQAVNAEVAKHQRFAGGPNGHAQECCFDAHSLSRQPKPNKSPTGSSGDLEVCTSGMTNAGSKPRALVVNAGLAVEVPNVDFFAYELVKKSTCHSPSSHILLQHPAPVPCVIAVDRRVRLARAPACLPFFQRDDALPSGMRRIDAAIRRDMRDRLDSRGNLHLRPQDRLRGRNSDFRHACTSAGLRLSLLARCRQPLPIPLAVRSAQRARIDLR